MLPELFASGYTFTSTSEVAQFAESAHGETSDFLQNLAKDIGGAVVAGFPEQMGDHIYNSAAIVDETHHYGVYRKIHLFNKEKEWFTPGDLGFRIFKLPKFTVGVMICFDWIFPEAMRTLSLKGAEIIAHPANLVLPYCQQAMVTRCLENHVYSITANRIGTEIRGEDEFKFTGQSQITDPDGNILVRGEKSHMNVQSNSIDALEAQNKSLNSYNHLFHDRRKEFYWDFQK